MKHFFSLFVIFFFLLYLSNIKINNDNLIRLRIIPNSNSILDQEIKYKVKDYLDENLIKELSKAQDKKEAKDKILNDIPNIEKNIRYIFDKNNYKLNFKINYGYNYFPPKDKYKEGYYESLVISIGDSKGDNWWCILFPNRCFVDIEVNKNFKFWFKEKFNNIFNK